MASPTMLVDVRTAPTTDEKPKAKLGMQQRVSSETVSWIGSLDLAKYAAFLKERKPKTGFLRIGLG